MAITTQQALIWRDLKEIKFSWYVKSMIDLKEQEGSMVYTRQEYITWKLLRMVWEYNIDIVYQYIATYPRDYIFTYEWKEYNLYNESVLRGFINNVIGIHD